MSKGKEVKDGKGANRVRGYRDLVVWQRAMRLVVAVYKETENFPRRELYSLTDQIRRAAVSIPANIAEGAARQTSGAFARHLDIALGSAAELDTHLQIALEIGYLSNEQFQALNQELQEITRMLQALYASIQRRRTTH